jgi:hypothetical protein
MRVRTPGLSVDLMDRVMDTDARRRHALLLPPTRLSVRIVMWLCGYTVRSLAALSSSLACKPASILVALNAAPACIFFDYSSASRAAPTSWRRSAPLLPRTAPSSSCVLHAVHADSHCRNGF